MRFGPVVAATLLACVGGAGWVWLGGQLPFGLTLGTSENASQTSTGSTPANQGPGGRGGGPQGKGRRAALNDAVVPVTVDVVGKQTIPVYRDGIGNVQALQAVTVRSQIDGRLSSVDFVEGQTVRKGDVLARIDPVVYKAQYDQAVAKKAQDEATLANARIDLERYRRLAASNAGPKQQADQQAAVVAQLEAQVQSDVAAMNNAKAFLDYTVITAPIEGRAGLRQVDSGNIIHASDASGLVLITQVAPIAVVFTLPQRDLPTVITALARGPVAVEVLRTGAASVLARGTLQTFDNQIDVSTGTIKLKAEFPNADQKLWPGQFVNARVVVDTLVDAKAVPTPAIRRGPVGTFVYVVGSDERAMMRKVEVVSQDATRSVIASGLEFGERVVTVGFAQLTDGKAVRIDRDEPTPTVRPGAAKADGQPRGERKRDGAGGRERQSRDDSGATDQQKGRKGAAKEAVQ